MNATRNPSVIVWTVFLAGLSAQAAPMHRYDGHQVVLIPIVTQEDMQQLVELEAASEDFDVQWHSLRTGVAEVRVSPDQTPFLDASGLVYQVVIEDLQQVLDDSQSAIAGFGFFDGFQTYTAHVARLNSLAAARPDLASVVSLGSSLEGRPLWAIRITGAGAVEKPAVFFHGCEHAREWISPPVVTFLADYLITNYDTDPQVAALVDNVEWFLLPVMNPDGYEYTWSDQRFWRKNRRNNLDGTFGVDLNRNWSVGWGGLGSSGMASSDIYRGTSPFSEPETQVLRDFFLDHANIRVHLDIHSYGNYCLWPYGYTTAPAAGDDVYQTLGSTVRQLVEDVHGNTYTIGPVASTLYFASGVSVDWVNDDQAVWSVTFELRGGGFAPSPTEILPACEENLPAMLYLGRWAWDCDDNGIADASELAGEPTLDCNDNGLLDACEMGVAACAVSPPSAVAVGGRYLALTPSPVDGSVALLLTSPDHPCLNKYVAADGSLVDSPVERTPQAWQTVFVYGDAVVPESTYRIQTVAGPVVSESVSVVSWNWGDVNHNTVSNLQDAQLIVKGFQGQFLNVTAEALDLLPCLPNGIVNLIDAQASVKAFQSQSYADSGCAMPCQ